MIRDILFCWAVTATLTAVIVESPFGAWLRRVLAGAPSEDAFEVWRNNGAHEEAIPQARNKPMNEALQCQKCVSFWMALITSAAWLLPGSGSAFAIALGVSWLGTRIALGWARDIEEGI